MSDRQVIYRYPIGLQSTIEIPVRATFLTVTLAGDGQPSLYFMVDPTYPTEKRTFHVAGTGIDLPPAAYMGKYLGTFKQDVFVWHVFEAIPTAWHRPTPDEGI